MGPASSGAALRAAGATMGSGSQSVRMSSGSRGAGGAIAAGRRTGVAGDEVTLIRLGGTGSPTLVGGVTTGCSTLLVRSRRRRDASRGVAIRARGSVASVGADVEADESFGSWSFQGGAIAPADMVRSAIRAQARLGIRPMFGPLMFTRLSPWDIWFDSLCCRDVTGSAATRFSKSRSGSGRIVVLSFGCEVAVGSAAPR